MCVWGSVLILYFFSMSHRLLVSFAPVCAYYTRLLTLSTHSSLTHFNTHTHSWLAFFVTHSRKSCERQAGIGQRVRDVRRTFWFNESPGCPVLSFMLLFSEHILIYFKGEKLICSILNTHESKMNPMTCFWIIFIYDNGLVFYSCNILL